MQNVQECRAAIARSAPQARYDEQFDVRDANLRLVQRVTNAL